MHQAFRQYTRVVHNYNPKRSLSLVRTVGIGLLEKKVTLSSEYVRFVCPPASRVSSYVYVRVFMIFMHV